MKRNDICERCARGRKKGRAESSAFHSENIAVRRHERSQVEKTETAEFIRDIKTT